MWVTLSEVEGLSIYPRSKSLVAQGGPATYDKMDYVTEHGKPCEAEHCEAMLHNLFYREGAGIPGSMPVPVPGQKIPALQRLKTPAATPALPDRYPCVQFPQPARRGVFSALSP